MQFIREHLVLTITAAVLLVGIVGEVIWAGFAQDGRQAQIMVREAVSNRLTAATPRPLNRDQLTRLAEAIKRDKTAVEQKRKELQDTQEAAMKPFKVVVGSGSDSKRVPAFPMDDTTFVTKSISVAFREAYSQQMSELFKEMKATEPADASAANGAADGEARGAAPPAPGVRGIPGHWSRRQDERRTEQPDPRDEAAQAALKGWIYASEGDLSKIDEDVASGAREWKLPQVWQRYLRYGVVRDVVQAIDDTNAQAKPRSGSYSVLNSAVKRLVSIDVASEFTMPPSTGGFGGPGSIVPTGNPLSPPMSYSGNPTPPGNPAGPNAKGDFAGSDLTKMACTQDYDVLRYSFTVVMPRDQLPNLVKNLMKNKLHTVLSVEFRDPARKTEGNGAAGGSSGDSGKAYFYGSQAVSEVTITGQLLLLTGWERNLMPIEVLKTLPSNVLRTEDNERVNGR